MNEPATMLLRKKEIMNWLGITKYEFEKLLEAHVLKPLRIRENGHSYFLKEDVRKIIETAKTRSMK